MVFHTTNGVHAPVVGTTSWQKRNTFFCNTNTHHTPAAISYHDNKRSMVFYSTKGDQNLAEFKNIPYDNWCCRFQSPNNTMLELLV